jgi:hypothetical protein
MLFWLLVGFIILLAVVKTDALEQEPKNKRRRRTRGSKH